MSNSVRTHKRQPTRLHGSWDSLGKNTVVGCHFLLQCMKVKSESEVAPSCLTLHNPMDCSLPGSSLHGISQARVLKWVSIAFSTTSIGSLKKKESSRKTCTSALLAMPKHLTVWIKTNCVKFFKRCEYQTTWTASWEMCMQVKKQQLEPNI